MQNSLKKIESYVYQNLLDKGRQIKSKYKVQDLVRTADLKEKLFQKNDTTNWSYKF